MDRGQSAIFSSNDELKPVLVGSKKPFAPMGVGPHVGPAFGSGRSVAW